MGLLEKVLSTDIKKEKNPLVYKNSLLRKADNLLSGKKPDNRELEAKKKKIKVSIDSYYSNAVLSDFHLIIPVNTFNFFKLTFRLIKGALFFADSDDILLPWIVTGYDQTTSSRLRFSSEDLKPFSDKSFSKPFFIPKSDKSAVKDYFSSREYGLLDDILIIPYTDSEGKLISFFLVSELNSFFTSYENLFKYSAYFLKMSKKSLLQFSKNRKKGKDKSLFLSNTKIMKEIDTFTENNLSDKSFFVLFINSQNILDKLYSLSSDIISTGFNMELFRIFSALTANGGKIFSLSGNSLFLIINSAALFDKDLLRHQINILLETLLPGLKKSGTEIINIFSVPADLSHLKDFIDV